MRRTRGQQNQSPEFLELKNFVLYFRVQELQILLQYANINRVGKKIDLQSRALDLLKTRMNDVKDKVREIYEAAKTGALVSAEPCLPPLTSPSPTPPTTTATHTSSRSTRNSAPTATVAAQPSAPVVSQSVAPSRQQNTAVVAPTIAEHYGRQMAHPAPAIMYPRNFSGYPNCPDVRLKNLAFYDVLGTLLRPSTLLPSSSLRSQEISFPLHLTPSQITEILSNRDYRNDNETLIQVQLRFCLMETSCEQEDYFPPGINVRVNNKPVTLPNPIPTNKPGVEPKRPPRPVNITQYVRLSATVTNTIHIQWCTEYNRGFVAACYLVRKLTSSDLLSRLKVKGPKPSDYTRGLIKEKLKEDADCEIATTLLKVSLICPLGKMRMTTPCRASTCSHLQCFDASLYLLMNEKKPTWNCPVCDKKAFYENLVIDGYFQQVLESSFLSLEDSEIQLHSDGSWSTHKGTCDTLTLDTPMKPSKIEVINDDLEVIAMEPPKTGIKIFSSGKADQSRKRANETTVDLTLSDSEEDDDIPLKRLMTKEPETARQLFDDKSTVMSEVFKSYDFSSYVKKLKQPSLAHFFGPKPKETNNNIRK
ncbi:E3 SUMO-protein ligase PIAS2-like isoform X2 [Culicoides brevitarsis]|uniref:E3 SUMO-protein ligase PIAS2-like isoform X2 n=1 Tax=Culicoides brevitarsis TaxID=469753 RepID=UPI00307B7F8E